MINLGETGSSFSENAEPLLLEGYQGMKRHETRVEVSVRICVTEAAESIVRLYEATNHPEKARSWREKLPAGKRPAD